MHNPVATITCNYPAARAGEMIRPEREEVAALRARLAAGDWLLPGEVGALFNPPKSRFTVRNWLATGKIRYRRTVGGFRECNPDDVLERLAYVERVHRDGQSTDEAGPDKID